MSVNIRVIGAGNLANEVRKKAQVMMLDLHAGLVQISAVDTGQFRAAWTVDTQVLKIENNVEHAEPLARGRSPQMPAGSIEAEIDRVTKL